MNLPYSALEELVSKQDADFYVFSAEVTNENADDLINIIRNSEQRKKNCSLILTTDGGLPDAGYRVMRALQNYYRKIRLYVFGRCKSTGTLMSFGANEIIMGDFGEFGPLDIQVAKDDELSHTSVINHFESLKALNQHMYLAFEGNFMDLKYSSENTITTRTAAWISAKLACAIYSPISAQIDPIKLGEMQRYVNIAIHYVIRLSQGRLESEDEILSIMSTTYPSHSFVIDFIETKKLFHHVKVRRPNLNENILQRHLFPYVRNQQEIVKKLDGNDFKQKAEDIDADDDDDDNPAQTVSNDERD